MSTKNEPETLNIRWLSSYQQCQFRHDMFFDLLESYVSNNSPYVVKLIIGAVAVKYPNNYFSVFIGISMDGDEQSDINYIKSMGQRQPEDIGRALFPQYKDLSYHS